MSGMCWCHPPALEAAGGSFRVSLAAISMLPYPHGSTCWIFFPFLMDWVTSAVKWLMLKGSPDYLTNYFLFFWFSIDLKKYVTWPKFQKWSVEYSSLYYFTRHLLNVGFPGGSVLRSLHEVSLLPHRQTTVWVLLLSLLGYYPRTPRFWSGLFTAWLSVPKTVLDAQQTLKSLWDGWVAFPFPGTMKLGELKWLAQKYTAVSASKSGSFWPCTTFWRVENVSQCRRWTSQIQKEVIPHCCDPFDWSETTVLDFHLRRFRFLEMERQGKWWLPPWPEWWLGIWQQDDWAHHLDFVGLPLGLTGSQVAQDFQDDLGSVLPSWSLFPPL